MCVQRLVKDKGAVAEAEDWGGGRCRRSREGGGTRKRRRRRGEKEKVEEEKDGGSLPDFFCQTSFACGCRSLEPALFVSRGGQVVKGIRHVHVVSPTKDPFTIGGVVTN